MKHRGEKYHLIYREKCDIFNKPLGSILYIFSKENVLGQCKKIAVCLTLEEGNLHENKQVFTYLGGVNAFIR
jgi:hypothetical protein